MNKTEKQQKLQALIEKMAHSDFTGGTDESRAQLIKGLNADVSQLAGEVIKPLTMEDIVDKNRAKVDTSGVDVPAGVRVTIEQDLATLDKLAEADRATQEAALDTVKTVAQLVITLAPMLLA